MSRQDPQLKLRLSPELKLLVEEASKASGRSMNAEIVARLQSSFDEASPAAHPELPRLYILLDSNGYPLSWSEIHEHLKAIRDAGRLNAVEMETHIVTPDMESSSRRKEETAKLAAFYRKQGRSKKISRDEG